MASLEKGPAPKAFKGRCTHQELAEANPSCISICGDEAVGYRFLDGDYTTLQLTWCAAGHVVVMNKLDFYEHTVWDFKEGA